MKARRGWAWPLVPLYAAGLAVKDGLRAFLGPRALGVLRVRRLAWPVISVGSLSAGGAGKTPVVIALAELLRARGWYVDVLSRGYGREGRGVERVDAEGVDAAMRFGDEPVVIARRVGVPVWVGAERFAAGVAAEMFVASEREADSSASLRNGKQGALRNDKQSAVRNDKQASLRNDGLRCVHLLDDGFQHRGLARAVDVVLVTEADFEDALLPAGNRREPLAALRRADAVVVREEESARVLPRLAGLLRDGAAIWTVRRTVSLPVAPNLEGRGKGLVAFCAIARPEDFFESLRRAGGRVVHSVAFSDHYRYTAGDIRQLTEACHIWGGDAFVTTEKDAVKITPEFRARLEVTAPLLVVGLEAAFLNPEDVVRVLEARIA